MSIKKVVTFLLISVFLVGCSVSTANLSNVKVGESISDGKVAKEVTVFSTDAPRIVVGASLNNAPDDTKVNISWRYLENGGQDIDSVEVTAKNGENLVSSTLSSPTNGWPTGKYEVTLKIETDNTKPIKKTFEVK